ncbi:MAG: PIG-L family deacetylase [Propionibacteriaceae bacterium]|jgi:N-acetyl-1-D-myo-inositol-2-amino-2-deoxy-alpha-D-glucopyranoside deacetylase|nr:PIG-L family deacetylase [Propionibacteriaceae bacterium]
MRFLFLHAHPDDETLVSGSLILALKRLGQDCLVLTATRGEQGEPATPIDKETLANERLSERAQALAQLGATDAGFLGQPPNRELGRSCRNYGDSGMAWVTATVAGPSRRAPNNALSRAPLPEVVSDVAQAAQHWGADLLVSYDRHGGYCHPDHVRCHHAMVAAARLTGLPWAQIVHQPDRLGRGVPDPQAAAQATWFEAGVDRDRLIAAHHCYASQFSLTDRGVLHVGGQIDPLQTRLGLWPYSPEWPSERAKAA